MAHHRSYSHTLSVAHAHITFRQGDVEGQSTVSLFPEPGFMAKNQLGAPARSHTGLQYLELLISILMKRNGCCVRFDGGGEGRSSGVFQRKYLRAGFIRVRKKSRNSFSQGQRKVREFCKKSRSFYIFIKFKKGQGISNQVREK